MELLALLLVSQTKMLIDNNFTHETVHRSVIAPFIFVTSFWQVKNLIQKVIIDMKTRLVPNMSWDIQQQKCCAWLPRQQLFASPLVVERKKLVLVTRAGFQ